MSGDRGYPGRPGPGGAGAAAPLASGVAAPLASGVAAPLPAVPVAAAVAVVLAGALAWSAPGAAPAQEAGGVVAAADTADDTEDEGPLVEAPFQFRIGPTVSSLSWEQPGAASEQRMDDAVLWGLDVASVAGRYAGFRLGGGVGSTSIALGGEEIDAIQYLADVAVEGRMDFVDPLSERGVVPYVTVGLGTVVHDPAPDSLVTRSQSSFTWGLGLEARIDGRIGARAEWRRVQAELQSAFDPVDRSGTTRLADRWFLGAFWTF